MVALASQLEPAQAKRAGDALLAILEKSTDGNVRAAASEGMAALASRLEPAQLRRVWDALIAVPVEKLPIGAGDNDPAWAGIVALAPKLEPASRNNLSTSAAAAILDYCISFDPDASLGIAERSEVAKSIVVARSISSPRSLAKLLSHPACVANQREILLKRFEELVCHDGKPVFLKPDVTDGKKPAGDPPPPRRFHNQHDAAVWMQDNWPDFDLETNYPVTWRGSR